MKIAVIGAMEEEVELLRKAITSPQTTNIANIEYIEGSIKNHDVILLKSGIGKVNAAMATTILLEKLTLQVPWKNLYTHPTKATIDGLFLLVVPKTGS